MAKLTRREAMTGAAGALTMTSATALGSQANSAVTFGIVGTGGRGRYVGTHMANDSRARVGAICDIYPDRIDLAKTQVPGADGAKVYKDYQKLLADPDIDVVLITTPVFLHAEHFEAAVEADKHIYCEKPAGPDVTKVKRLMRAGEKVNPKKRVQFGYQQRFSPEYLRGHKMVTSGEMGEMKMMMSFWILGGPPPTSFTSKYPEDQMRVRYWVRWTELGGGPIVEQDCHGVDMLNWFAQSLPERAVGHGGVRYPMPYGDWTSDHHDIIYSYPGGVDGWLISIKNAGGFRDVKEQFYCTKGMIETARTYFKHHGPKEGWRFTDADRLEDRSLIEKVNSKREITIDAVEAFYTGIVENKPLNMTSVAAESTLTSILGRMAYEYEREVTWEEMLRSG
ncbi:MAG: Gfo/Idh/MocA family oxidoreductase [bacterium]|nr:Gfo/Idh/MocA family oxidoreductase [bacterium]